jgi:hypothetical protein
MRAYAGAQDAHRGMAESGQGAEWAGKPDKHQ